MGLTQLATSDDGLIRALQAITPRSRHRVFELVLAEQLALRIGEIERCAQIEDVVHGERGISGDNGCCSWKSKVSKTNCVAS